MKIKTLEVIHELLESNALRMKSLSEYAKKELRQQEERVSRRECPAETLEEYRKEAEKATKRSCDAADALEDFLAHSWS